MKIILFILLLFPLISFSQEIEHKHDIYSSFIENKGQWNSDIIFKSKFNGGNLWIQQHKFLFHFQDYSEIEKAHSGNKQIISPTFKQDVVHLNFKGSNFIDSITKLSPTENYYNYFLGNDSSKWASGVHGFSEATLHDFYTGIDFKLIEKGDQMKYEFHVKPMSQIKQIQLEYFGQKNIFIDRKGNLLIETSLGRIIEEKPYSYQVINGKIIEIPTEFILSDNLVSFKVSNYNEEYELIIDPILVFATYSGSKTDNFGMTATYASDGKVYSGGTIYGNAYPTPENTAYDISSNFTVVNNGNLNYGITDVFISKYSSDGSKMIWTNFIGGGNDKQGTETVHSLIADKSDNIYLFGATSSIDFPIFNGYQKKHAGGKTGLNFTANGVFHLDQGTDIYVTKISSNGQDLLGSTYIGGAGNDGPNYNTNYFVNPNVNNGYDSLLYNYGDNSRGEIILDTSGNCIIASCTHSTNFPVKNYFQKNLAGLQDGVIFQLSSDLSKLNWSSYFGGANNDACYSVKVDNNGDFVFSGGTSSNNLPKTIGGWQSSYNLGKADGFVGKISKTGNVLKQVSYIGTNDYDQAYFVDVDRNNNVYLLGQSVGGQFPIINASYSVPNTCQFICKLNSSLTNILHSTTFGSGSSAINISPSAFMVDICGNVYLSGWGANILQNTPMTNMPITSNAFQSNSTGFDFYLFVLNRNFDNPIYGSYMGGWQSREHVDGGTSRFDKNGVIYQSVCGGCGGNSDFPTSPNPGVWSNYNLSSNCNNVVFKFDFGIIPKASFEVDKVNGCRDFTVKFKNNSTISDSYKWDFGNGIIDSTTFSPIVTYTNVGDYNVTLTLKDSICNLTDTNMIKIHVYDSLKLVASNDTIICSPKLLKFVANSFGTSSKFLWSSSRFFTDTLNGVITDSVLLFVPANSSTYFVKIWNSGCEITDSVNVEMISSNLEIKGKDSLCMDEVTHFSVNNKSTFYTFSYEWSPNNIIIPPTSNTMDHVDVLINSTGYLYLNSLANTGCLVRDSVLIHVSPFSKLTPDAQASDYYVPEGASVTLIGKPDGYMYQWLPGNTTFKSSNQFTDVTVSQSGDYVLIVGDLFCKSTDTVYIETYPYTCDEPYVFVPNAFSPNGDLENDLLIVRGEMLKEFTIKIFNRWGELVYEGSERDSGWDGTYKGRKLDPDVFDYYLTYTCYDEIQKLKKGNITLLK